MRSIDESNVLASVLLAFLLNRLDPALKIVGLDSRHVQRRDEQRSLSEEISHLFQRTLSSLGEECPEEEGVGKVAHL